MLSNPKPRFGTVNVRNRGYLPHWEADCATYFVTFRLVDSLPQPAIQDLERILQSKLTKPEQARKCFATLERYADAGSGECLLANPACACIVAESLQNKHALDYRLIAWCVMPNHVHVCFRMLPGKSLAPTIQAWKSVSARRINTILLRTGTVWMREYYDRLVRDAAELARTIRYIDHNPGKAGLIDWRWKQILSPE